ncbi:MAG: HAAS signaling domain-containing protein [Gemmataceae bacterium]
MATGRWLERVRAALLRHGLPEDYAERLVGELADHADDLDAGGAAIDRLGDPEGLAQEAVAGYRSASFAGRSPVLGLLVLPAAAGFAGLCLYTLFADLMIEGVALAVGPAHPAVRAAAAALVGAAGFAVPLAVCVAAWPIHRHSGRPAGWYVGACALIGLLAALLVTTWEAQPQGCPAVFVEWALGPSWWQLAHGAAPLAFGWAWALRLSSARSV